MNEFIVVQSETQHCGNSPCRDVSVNLLCAYINKKRWKKIHRFFWVV